MRNQFDSCSYQELTSCVRARIKWIREYREFLKDRNTLPYSHIRAGIVLKITISEFEIRRLLKMRRKLKKSPLRNWDTNYFKKLSETTREEINNVIL